MRIFDLSLGQMLWSRRSIFLALVVGGPVLLAATVRLIALLVPSSSLRVNGAMVGGPSIFGMMIWLLYVRFIVPVLGVFYGTALIADEVDDKTITYLFTRPIPRSAVLIGKYLAYLGCTVLLILPTVMIVFFLIVPLGGGSVGASVPSSDRPGHDCPRACGLRRGVRVVGARLKRPLVIGLVFAFGWEPTVMLVPGYLKQLTVAYYVQALVPHAMPEDSTLGAILQVFNDVPSVAVSLAALAIITPWPWLAAPNHETRVYVLEQ
jgi:hypothetical protein